MKKLLLVAAAAALAAPLALAQSVIGTKHDLKSALGTSQQVCVFCHTPHQPAGRTTDPLWNHTLSSTTTYGVYASATLNATPLEIGGGSGSTNLCMSCHDGTVGIGSMYNKPNIPGGSEETPSNAASLITSNANMGTDLSNDHPVNFNYDAALVTADGGLVSVATLPSWALVGGKVQCASCHDPHDSTFYPFLTASNVNSALCTTCHIK